MATRKKRPRNSSRKVGKAHSGSARLSKSRYMDGRQCHKLLWWKVHEPAEPDDGGPDLQVLHGQRVGQAARAFIPGGVLIDLPPHKVSERVAATQAAIAARAPVIYEAAFVEDDVFVSVDILERRKSGYTLIEVKGTLDVKEHHIPDVAVQLHVLERAGIDVKRVELMHLNRDCRHPDLSNLFVRQNITALARKAAREAPRIIRELAAMLRGELPQIEPGGHCSVPYPCPFVDRCWPILPKHHLGTLYRLHHKKRDKLLAAGYETIHDLPADFKAAGIARRQIDSIRRGKLVVERELAAVLGNIRGPIAFLDFETIAPPVPVWPGCAPCQKVPVQLSCHRYDGREVSHRGWLADGREDPREPLARALIAACEGATTVLTYNASFEKERIKELIQALPELAPELSRILDRIHDLLPIIRDHVYHPDFDGSFSIKAVLPALVPGLGYDDLEIRDGGSASGTLEAMLLEDGLPAADRAAARQRLLDYCERDTFAMVKLLERLHELAKA